VRLRVGIDDYGRTWSPVERFPSRTQQRTGCGSPGDGESFACNPFERPHALSVLMSEDNGVTWPQRVDLEAGAGEYSYPSVIQADNGRVHVWLRTKNANIPLRLGPRSCRRSLEGAPCERPCGHGRFLPGDAGRIGTRCRTRE